MSTPPRPSLADTLARIDALLADLKKTTAAEATRLDEAVADHAAKLDAQPPRLRCARRALIDSPFCAAHKRIPREMIEELGPVEPGLRTVAEASAALLGRERPPARPPVLIPPARPGWLGRALRRLFSDGAS